MSELESQQTPIKLLEQPSNKLKIPTQTKGQ